jgi:surface antigen
VLGRGDKDVSQTWENPRTGARGTVTPVSTAYSQDGLVCRDFLASHVQGAAETWLQGEACRLHRGRWEVRSLRRKQT